MQAILKMCSLEFVDTSFLLEGLFNFRETKAFWTKVTSNGFEFSRFADAGYESAIFFELLGPILIIVLFFAIFTLVKLITKYIMVKFTIDSWMKRKLLERTPYLQIISRFQLEGAIEIGLSAMISILMLKEESFESFWEVVSVCCSVLSLIGLVLSLGYYARLINRYLEEAEIAGDPTESSLH